MGVQNQKNGTAKIANFRHHMFRSHKPDFLTFNQAQIRVEFLYRSVRSKQAVKLRDIPDRENALAVLLRSSSRKNANVVIFKCSPFKVGRCRCFRLQQNDALRARFTKFSSTLAAASPNVDDNLRKHRSL